MGDWWLGDVDHRLISPRACVMMKYGQRYGGGVVGAGGEGFKPRIPERVGRWPEGEEGVLRSPQVVEHHRDPDLAPEPLGIPTEAL